MDRYVCYLTLGYHIKIIYIKLFSDMIHKIYLENSARIVDHCRDVSTMQWMVAHWLAFIKNLSNLPYCFSPLWSHSTPEAVPIYNRGCLIALRKHRKDDQLIETVREKKREERRKEREEVELKREREKEALGSYDEWLEDKASIIYNLLIVRH